MCVFCQIAKREIPTSFLFEDEDVVAFRDIRPLAPVHVLVIPKRHIPSVNDLTEADQALAGKMILVGQRIARDLAIAEKGYKLLLRSGKDGGQEVDHLHLHLIGGAKLYEEIRPE